MRFFAYLSLSLMFAGTLLADRFNVGGIELNIPAPEGYTRVTEQMVQVTQFFEVLEDPARVMLAVYIPENCVRQALDGGLPEFDRYLMLAMHPSMAEILLTEADFGKVVAELMSRQERKRNAELEGQSAQGGQRDTAPPHGIADDSGLAIKEPAPLAFHRKTADSYAFSVPRNLDAAGNLLDVSTVTVLNVSGRGLFLGAFSTRGNMDWTRSASVAWENAILANNPPPPEPKLFGMSVEVVVSVLSGGLTLVGFWMAGRVKKRRSNLL